VADVHVCVLNTAEVSVVDQNAVLGKFGKSPAAVRSQADGLQVVIVGPLKRLDDVGAVAADAHAQQQIPRCSEVDQLLDEHIVVAHIVAQRGQVRRVVVEAQDTKAPGPAEARAFAEVHGEVARVGGAAAVAACEERPAVLASFAQQIYQGGYAVDVDRIDDALVFGEITLDPIAHATTIRPPAIDVKMPTMDDTARLIGVEIGATKLQAIRGGADGRVEQTVRETADCKGGADAILLQLRRMVQTLFADGPAAAIGFGFGGPVDTTDGRVITSHQVEGWEGKQLAAWALETFGVPCRVANDTDAATLAEATVGAGRGCGSTFYTNIGSGIGGGLVRDGELYTGRLGAMEFGHTWTWSTLLERWDRVECLCSGWAIGRRAKAMAEGPQGRDFIASCGGEMKSIDARTVAEAWQRGDPTAARLMEDVIDSLSRSLCNVIALLNPEVIVIGGGVALTGPPLFEALDTAVRRHVFAPFAENFKVVPAVLGESAVPVGAMLMAGR